MKSMLLRAKEAVRPALQRSLRFAAVAGIAAFLSFPIGPQAPHASIARWLGELVTHVH